MKSNFLKSPVIPVEEKKVEVVKPEEPKEAEPTPEELEMKRQQKIRDALHRAKHAAVTHLNLSTESIYSIF